MPGPQQHAPPWGAVLALGALNDHIDRSKGLSIKGYCKVLGGDRRLDGADLAAAALAAGGKLTAAMAEALVTYVRGGDHGPVVLADLAKALRECRRRKKKAGGLAAWSSAGTVDRIDSVYPNWLVHRRDFRLHFSQFAQSDEYSPETLTEASLGADKERRTEEDLNRIAEWLAPITKIDDVLDAARYRQLVRSVELVDKPAGAVVFAEGAVSEFFYFIWDGAVGLSKGGARCPFYDVQVCAAEARGLIACDRATGASDPFVVMALVRLSDGKVLDSHKSAPQQRTVDPVWDEKALFDLGKRDPAECALRVRVFDHDILDNDGMGECVVPLSALSPMVEYDAWLPLKRFGAMAEEATGEVRLRHSLRVGELRKGDCMGDLSEDGEMDDMVCDTTAVALAPCRLVQLNLPFYSSLLKATIDERGGKLVERLHEKCKLMKRWANPRARIRRFVAGAKERRFKHEGEVVVGQGDASESLCIVLHGKVALSRELTYYGENRWPVAEGGEGGGKFDDTMSQSSLGSLTGARSRAHARSLPSLAPAAVASGGGKRMLTRRAAQEAVDKAAGLAQLRSKLAAASYRYPGGEIEAMFQTMDTDASRTIEEHEFSSAVRKVLKLNRKAVSDGELEALYRALDADGSGAVDVDELLGFLGRQSQSAEASLATSAVSRRSSKAVRKKHIVRLRGRDIGPGGWFGEACLFGGGASQYRAATAAPGTVVLTVDPATAKRFLRAQLDAIREAHPVPSEQAERSTYENFKAKTETYKSLKESCLPPKYRKRMARAAARERKLAVRAGRGAAAAGVRGSASAPRLVTVVDMREEAKRKPARDAEQEVPRPISPRTLRSRELAARGTVRMVEAPLPVVLGGGSWVELPISPVGVGVGGGGEAAGFVAAPELGLGLGLGLSLPRLAM